MSSVILKFLNFVDAISWWILNCLTKKPIIVGHLEQDLLSKSCWSCQYRENMVRCRCHRQSSWKTSINNCHSHPREEPNDLYTQCGHGCFCNCGMYFFINYLCCVPNLLITLLLAYSVYLAMEWKHYSSWFSTYAGITLCITGFNFQFSTFLYHFFFLVKRKGTRPTIGQFQKIKPLRLKFLQHVSLNLRNCAKQY